MHTHGIEERGDEEGSLLWFIRFECCGCRWKVGLDFPASEESSLIDRLIWTDDANHVIERMPPYLQVLVREDVNSYAKVRGEKVVTFDLVLQARLGERIDWDVEAEKRLANVPAPVRAMAKIELERTAVKNGMRSVTVMLMEQVKARYFGLAAQK